VCSCCSWPSWTQEVQPWVVFGGKGGHSEDDERSWGGGSPGVFEAFKDAMNWQRRDGARGEEEEEEDSGE